jgi:nucleoid-associated protein YgaU
MVVASVLAAGVSAALFFRKDASQVPPRQAGLEDSPFGRQVERRASAGAGRVKGTLAGARVDREPAWRVPTAAPAAIAERTKAPDGPTFAKSLNPVGALLAPIESVPDDDLGDLASGGDASDQADGSTVEHTIVDGDTLAQLAIRYLGTAERYLEIFELNRDILSTPDLLPIGTLIKIPQRSAAPSSNGGSSTSSEGDEIPLPIVPIEPLKSEPAAAAAE